MALLGMSASDRVIGYGGIELLPDLECDVICSEVVLQVIEEGFVAGLDDWWPNFVADMCL